MSREIPHKDLQLPQITAIVGFDEDFIMPLPKCHPAIANIMKLCLQRDPKTRPNFSEIFVMVEEAERNINQKCKISRSNRFSS